MSDGRVSRSAAAPPRRTPAGRSRPCTSAISRRPDRAPAPGAFKDRLQRADTQFEVGTTPAHESGITDGATPSGMPSASRILTRALPAGLLVVLAAPAAALAAPATSA